MLEMLEYLARLKDFIENTKKYGIDRNITVNAVF